MIGETIAHYRITAKLGEGGMGEVYRATDTKLGREVALKILPQAVANDPDRLARFEREAKVLAALNHPHIAQIYGVEERALVMELVEGEDLHGPLPLATALDYALQIAEALEAAHEKGVTHRDLKPANVKVTPAGVVKVLDFGLAKAADEPAVVSGNPSMSPTLTMRDTQMGVIMGTAAYMSPEQAAGKPVDKRADIWSFGVVLWELLTGKRLFDGETVSHVLAAVLTKDPDWTQLPANTPAGIRKLLRRCLQRDLRCRLPDIGAARLEIEDAMGGGPAEEVGPQVAPARRPVLPWALFAAAIVTSVALGLIAYRHATEEARVLKLLVPPPEKGAFGSDSPAISPDGRHLAFVAAVDGNYSLWVRDLDSLAAHSLPGTGGANFPFWSPDSRFVAFFAGRKLKKIDIAGGPALTLCDSGGGRGGTWSKNDVIVFASSTNVGLLRVAAAGGSSTSVTSLDQRSSEVSHRWPWFLPDGHHFLYTSLTSDAEQTRVYLADLNSKDRRPVLAAKSNAVYTPPGFLLFVREGTLMAQSFDAGQGQTTGAEVRVAEHIDYLAGEFLGRFSSSQSGVLVYTSGASNPNVQLTWFDRSGNMDDTLGMPGELQWPAISPDGRTVAIDRRDPQTGLFDIWLHDLARGATSRFTFGPGSNRWPVWSPDGSHIAFYSLRDRPGHVYQKATAGVAGDEVLDRALDEPPRNTRADDWSRDGRYLIEGVAVTIKKRAGIWVLPLSGDRRAFPYAQTEFNEGSARLSPDGRWLAYSSDETKRNEVYVQTFPSPGGKWQVSTSGGDGPVWRRDGRELFFIGADQKMMAVEVKGGGKFEAGVPKPLFDTRFANGNASFDVGKDGRFLIPVPIEQAANVPMTVVVNWTAELKK